MTDYLKNGPLDEKDMSDSYLSAEKNYREQVKRLWDEAQEIKLRLRGNVGLSREERLDSYREQYESRIAPKFSKLASDFTAQIMGPLGNDERLLTQGTGPKFGDYLVSLSGKPVEELPELMRTAQRTGETDLVRAVAQVALDKNQFGVFNEWAASEPERAAALRRIRSTPGPEQLVTRTTAPRPPKATPDSLEPTYADRERAKKAAAVQRASEKLSREGFYGIRLYEGRNMRVI